MKFETTLAFDSDYRHLKREHAVAFKTVVREKFAPACDAYAKAPITPWPGSLRVKSVRAAPGIWEMTWSFASPDGRATFELVTVDTCRPAERLRAVQIRKTTSPSILGTDLLIHDQVIPSRFSGSEFP